MNGPELTKSQKKIARQLIEKDCRKNMLMASSNWITSLQNGKRIFIPTGMPGLNCTKA